VGANGEIGYYCGTKDSKMRIFLTAPEDRLDPLMRMLHGSLV
jgi:hypothetical protein